ncbi:hypothetical protein B0H14DRAFT_2652512 [Mycena olivaceomarginata]|nr:hypothetical protein B0H14DRAFT_2652512 [Mycena olivaceomarginata]
MHPPSHPYRTGGKEMRRQQRQDDRTWHAYAPRNSGPPQQRSDGPVEGIPALDSLAPEGSERGAVAIPAEASSSGLVRGREHRNIDEPKERRGLEQEMTQACILTSAGFRVRNESKRRESAYRVSFTYTSRPRPHECRDGRPQTATLGRQRTLIRSTSEACDRSRTKRHVKSYYTRLIGLAQLHEVESRPYSEFVHLSIHQEGCGFAAGAAAYTQSEPG